VPWAPLVVLLALLVPAFGSRFYTFVANDVVIWALFATSLNLLVGYTGLVSFGHAAYFGIGAYTTHPHEEARGAVPAGLPAAGVLAAAFALLFGLFCVRLTRIYFAMLTLAFAQIVWAICFKWNEVTGGEQGMRRCRTRTVVDGAAAAARRSEDQRPLLPADRPAGALCLFLLHRVVGSRSAGC